MKKYLPFKVVLLYSRAIKSVSLNSPYMKCVEKWYGSSIFINFSKIDVFFLMYIFSCLSLFCLQSSHYELLRVTKQFLIRGRQGEFKTNHILILVLKQIFKVRLLWNENKIINDYHQKSFFCKLCAFGPKN